MAAYTTINKPSSYFNTKTYNGTGSAQSITGVGFRPDWLWIKHREDVSNHKLQDVVRGSTKVIGSNENSAEATVAQGVTSFDSDGFSLGTDASVNGTGAAGIVAWNWLAGGSQGSSNTSGSINTTYTSVNTTSGFSISKYTGNGVSGATVGHGLGAIPKWIIVKALNTTDNWEVYHTSLGAEKYLELNRTDAQADSTAIWNDTEPTSSVFSIGNNSGVNTNGNPYIAYCFALKRGYSKFGKYTGNGQSGAGSFIYTGFKPAWVLGKRTDSSNNWFLFDNKRDPSNLTQRKLRPDTSAAENNNSGIVDFTANGFKYRLANNANWNTDYDYIFIAFAETPFKYSNAR